MSRAIMTVIVPDLQTYRTYDYGYGKVISTEEIDNKIKVVVDYGDDEYRADYQAGRFWSGLYFAKVEFVDA